MARRQGARMTPRSPMASSGSSKRRWRRMDCLGKCTTTTGTGGIVADVHEQVIAGGYVATLYRAGAPERERAFKTEGGAQRAVERWLASQPPRSRKRAR